VLTDLAQAEAGVYMRTATGRMCSVVLMRHGSVDAGGNDSEGDLEEGEETEFRVVDGKAMGYRSGCGGSAARSGCQNKSSMARCRQPQWPW